MQGNTLINAYRRGRREERELCLDMLKQLEETILYYCKQSEHNEAVSPKAGRLMLENLNKFRLEFEKEKI